MRLNEASFLSEGSMLMVRKRGAPERTGAQSISMWNPHRQKATHLSSPLLSLALTRMEAVWCSKIRHRGCQEESQRDFRKQRSFSALPCCKTPFVSLRPNRRPNRRVPQLCAMSKRNVLRLMCYVQAARSTMVSICVAAQHTRALQFSRTHLPYPLRHRVHLHSQRRL